jgi:hypothetical protein
MQPKNAACRARKTRKGVDSGVVLLGTDGLVFSPCSGRIKAVTAGTSMILPEFVVVHSFRFPPFPCVWDMICSYGEKLLTGSPGLALCLLEMPRRSTVKAGIGCKDV